MVRMFSVKFNLFEEVEAHEKWIEYTTLSCQKGEISPDNAIEIVNIYEKAIKDIKRDIDLISELIKICYNLEVFIDIYQKRSKVKDTHKALLTKIYIEKNINY